MGAKIPFFSIDFDRPITFSQVKSAIIAGNIGLVRFYLSQPNPPLADPLEDTGYPDEDGYNSIVINSLLYEAVPNIKILDLLLKDGRFDPNSNNKDAFYRCLLSGSIEGLNLFYNDRRFTFPDDALLKAVDLGGKELIEFLLELDELEGYKLFSQEVKAEALGIAYSHKDNLIFNILEEYISGNRPQTCMP